MVVAEDAELPVRSDERAERPGHQVARFRSRVLKSDRTSGVGWTMPRSFGMRRGERAKCTGLDHIGRDFANPSGQHQLLRYRPVVQLSLNVKAHRNAAGRPSIFKFVPYTATPHVSPGPCARCNTHRRY